jgi:hypothetical protein
VFKRERNRVRVREANSHFQAQTPQRSAASLALTHDQKGVAVAESGLSFLYVEEEGSELPAHFDGRTLGSEDASAAEMRDANFYFRARFKDLCSNLTISTSTRPNLTLKHIHHHERPRQLHAKDCPAGWPPLCFGCFPYPQATVCSGTCSICETIDL